MTLSSAWVLVCALLMQPGLCLRLNAQPQVRAIPNRLVLNYKVDLLKDPLASPKHSENIKKTMAIYKDMQVEFLDDEGCAKAIESAHSSALAKYFREETFGPYKSDICRLAQLREGGYYMDNDLEAISDLRDLVPAQAAFVSVAQGNKDIFQALIGVAPEHPIIRRALNDTYDHYEQNGSPSTVEWVLGPQMMAKAYKWWAEEEVAAGSRAHAQRSGPFQESYFFVESQDMNHYGLSRQSGQGCCCNFVVGDQASQRSPFWSRFVGASERCS